MGFEIINHPVNALVSEGENASFSVSTSGFPLIGGEPKTYQWYYSAWWLSNDVLISGETNSSINLTGVTVDMNERKYYCKINDLYESKRAYLYLKTYRPTINQPLDTSITLREGSYKSAAGSHQPFRISYTQPVSGYSEVLWTKNGVEVSNSPHYRFYPNYKIDDGNDVKCKVKFIYPEGTLQRITKTTISVIPQKPTITEHPIDRHVFDGNTVQFDVEAIDSTGTISYQWYEDNGITESIIAGSSGTSLSLTAHTSADGFSYFCNVTNSGGTKKSDEATLNILDDSLNVSLQAVGPNTIGLLEDGKKFIIILNANQLKTNDNNYYKAHRFNLIGDEENIKKLSQFIDTEGINTVKEFIEEVKPSYTELNTNGGIVMHLDITEGSGADSTTSTQATSAGIGEEFIVYESEDSSFDLDAGIWLTINGEWKVNDNYYYPPEQNPYFMEENPPNSRSSLVFASSASVTPAYINTIDLIDS